MKNKLKLFLCSALAVVCLACDPDKGPVAPTPDDNSGTPSTPATGAVTPVGTPEGAALTATIGPVGVLLLPPTSICTEKLS